MVGRENSREFLCRDLMAVRRRRVQRLFDGFGWRCGGEEMKVDESMFSETRSVPDIPAPHRNGNIDIFKPFLKN